MWQKKSAQASSSRVPFVLMVRIMPRFRSLRYSVFKNPERAAASPPVRRRKNGTGLLHLLCKANPFLHRAKPSPPFHFRAGQTDIAHVAVLLQSGRSSSAPVTGMCFWRAFWRRECSRSKRRPIVLKFSEKQTGPEDQDELNQSNSEAGLRNPFLNCEYPLWDKKRIETVGL